MLRKRQPLEKPNINMMPMIDVVFLLLTFFVLTFRIIVPEGDFNVQMSPIGQAQPADVDAEAAQIRLIAQEDGSLAAIQLNGNPVEHFGQLRQRVSAIILANPDLEVELFPDEYLHYEYVIQAITAVSGEMHEGQIRKISDHIKFIRKRLE
ncbi:MAG: biopolymer transporter ExbD [Planctomycetaceae bacterium]|nr:biopolymer transporter ExbD [Planctomycetaceae bacterium]